MTQRLLLPAVCMPAGRAAAGGPLTSVPAVKAMGLICSGICVAGSCASGSVMPLDSPPGEAVMSWEPQMGHTMSAHEVFEG